MIARSTLAQWVGQTGVQLQPSVDALPESVLTEVVIHADETLVQMLAPGEKKLTARMFGPIAPRRFRRSGPWSTTSVQAVPVSMCVTFSAFGMASWYAAILQATKPVLRKAPKICCMAHARREFSICTWRAKISRPNRSFARLAACTKLNTKRGT